MSKQEIPPPSKSEFSRRKFLQRGLAAGTLAAGVPGPGLQATDSPPSAEEKAPSSPVPEDIRSTQNTVLEAEAGRVEKLRLGEKAFTDGDEVLGYVPEEFLARRYVLAPRSGVKVLCTSAGYVYAVTAADGDQVRELQGRGFKALDFPKFEIFAGGKGPQAVAYQKRLEVGEKFELGNWVILIFGPEERGGVPYEKMRSLQPPAFLPDGSEFKTWETPLTFSRTYYVDQSHPHASDGNPGTEDLPFKTINRAAQILEPGERVIVGVGVYRECVRPARGGTDPEHMISYEAKPGAKVVIKGSELLKVKWEKSVPWALDDRFHKVKATVQDTWMARLPPALFAGYNPFGTVNYRQMEQMPYWNLSTEFADSRARLYLLVCGLLFQNGKRLKQVSRFTDLFTNEGSFWVETNGVTLHVSPYGGIDPNEAEWEATAREQIFAPEKYFLAYIRVKGFFMEHAGNTFPFPQRGAISVMIGHHWIIEDNTIEWANSVGIDIGDQGEPFSKRPPILGFHVVRRNTLNDIGTTGVTGPKPWGSVIEDNVFHRNAWHDIEELAECGAIKTHSNLCVLMRRNLIFDTLHGAGIYIDSSNSNSRICQNVIVFAGSSQPIVDGAGGIYIEAALAPNLVDHNFVWGSTKSNGIFVYTSSKVIISHNLVANCAMAAIRVVDAPGRKLGDREIPSGDNKIYHNILTANGWDIGVYSPRDLSDYNLFGVARLPNPFHINHLGKVSFPTNATGTNNQDLSLSDWRGKFGFDIHSSEVEIAAEFNPSTLELEWSVRGSFTAGPPILGATYDFWNRPATVETVSPGPFGSIPSTLAKVIVDPRLPAK